MKKIRIIALVLMVVLAIGLFAGCSSTGKCDYCGKEAKLNKVTYMGESAKLCDDCKLLFDLGTSILGGN